ncbi:MAG: C4-dicarboxylate ABC transporter [Rubrivivax sp. SCN 70-15]|nr:MAG: C4-dicarboxylate ABC transporter [Rubrivivax sp. SCN 70-15]
MKTLFTSATLTLASCLWAASAFAAEPIVIKFSHVVAADTNKGKTAEYFKQIVEERSKGAVKVEVYHNSTLYKDKEEMEALQLGAVQMLAPTPGKFGPLGVREFEVLDLPFLFDNLEEEHRVTQGPVGKALLKKLEPKGILGLAFWDNGFKDFTSNKPLREVTDFRGQKIRIQSSKVIEAQMRSVGALPQVMAFSELYTALQTGVVDGQENPPNVIYPSKLYEAQKYLTVSNHAYHGYAVITNKKFWEGLPPDTRAMLEQALADASKHFNEAAEKENQEGLEAIRKSGRTEIITLTPEQRRAWKKAMVKVHAEMADRVGKSTIEAIYKETGFDPSKL